ncbi:MAG TPA: hypothetical protein VMV25_02515 [Steroidobacteraceae bacterium]|nr:hypothetical protein [Steroidobacteraceae bacterium]
MNKSASLITSALLALGLAAGTMAAADSPGGPPASTTKTETGKHMSHAKHMTHAKHGKAMKHAKHMKHMKHVKHMKHMKHMKAKKAKEAAPPAK